MLHNYALPICISVQSKRIAKRTLIFEIIIEVISCENVTRDRIRKLNK